MNIQRFLDLCNKSPLFKKDPPITRALLKKVDFIRDEYHETNVVILKNKLISIAKETIRPQYKGFKPDKKWETRHMLHKHLLLLENNKKLLEKMRQKLDMPFQDRGFALDPKNTYEKNFVNVALGNESQEYKDWISRIIGKNNSKTSLKQKFELAYKVNEKVYGVAEYLLKKWHLPSRYHDAIIELVLFDRIIPVDQNISFERRYFPHSGDAPRMSINFDKDTTKKELLQFIEKDSLGLFSGKKKVISPTLKRNSSKNVETEKMREIYNQAKKNGSNDSQALNAVHIHKALSHLTSGAIRKRLKN